MSKEAKFTAGDWELAEGKTYCAIKQVNTGDIIADMRTVNAVYNKHNAHLVKTAPKLYAMLWAVIGEMSSLIGEVNDQRASRITNQTESEPDYHDYQTLHEIQLLLAEARGE